MIVQAVGAVLDNGRDGPYIHSRELSGPETTISVPTICPGFSRLDALYVQARRLKRSLCFVLLWLWTVMDEWLYAIRCWLRRRRERQSEQNTS